MVVFINSVGFVAISMILCAAICTGKNMYDDIDVHGSEGKPIDLSILQLFPTFLSVFFSLIQYILCEDAS